MLRAESCRQKSGSIDPQTNTWSVWVFSQDKNMKYHFFFNLKIMIKMRRFASFLSYLTVNNESLGFWTVCWTEEVFWIITVGLLKGQFTQITKRCLLLLSVLLFLVSSQSEFTGFYLVRFLNNRLRWFTCDDWNVTNRTFVYFYSRISIFCCSILPLHHVLEDITLFFLLHYTYLLTSVTSYFADYMMHLSQSCT